MTAVYWYSSLLLFAALLALAIYILLIRRGATTIASPRLIIPTTVGDAPFVSALNDHLYFAGQPTATSLPLFRDRGVRTIINLRSDSEMAEVNFDEEALTEQLDMTYMSIPVSGDARSEATLPYLFDILTQKSDQPLLLHCATSRRAGYVWAIYQAVRQGQSLRDAIEYGRQAGMNSALLKARASAYIKRHLRDVKSTATVR